ncbi:hypothetical protein Bbelb_060920 [Branchiostoma belcheri]|nr:hypothetical protein Bbelb_060920 [Branchiostoma belcheri]
MPLIRPVTAALPRGTLLHMMIRVGNYSNSDLRCDESTENISTKDGSMKPGVEEGHVKHGQQQQQRVDDIRDWTGRSLADCTQMGKGREEWRKLVLDATTDSDPPDEDVTRYDQNYAERSPHNCYMLTLHQTELGCVYDVSASGGDWGAQQWCARLGVLTSSHT